MTLRIGVIPTNGRDCVDVAIATLRPQVDNLLVIEAGPNITYRQYPGSVTVIQDDSGTVNISRWWNKGLDWAQAVATALEQKIWDVAIINDDVQVPPTWLCYIADDMRTLGCVAACSGGVDNGPVVHRHVGSANLYNRLQGFAFVLAGESGIRADETFRWYWSDDHVHNLAVQMGGAVQFPNCHPIHRHPNEQVSFDMQVMITEDAAKFKQRWGMIPS